MADLEDAKRIARSLPGSTGEDGFAVMNGGKARGFAWLWNERIDPKKAKVPNPEVLAVRTADLDEKEGLLAADPEKFFTEPHYNGFPAVLVRLARIEPEELAEVLEDGWRCVAPKSLAKQFDESR